MSPQNGPRVILQPTLHTPNLMKPMTSATGSETVFTEGTGADSASPTSAPTDAASAQILNTLNELLEAERAGARVALETAREITAPDLTELVLDIQKDEVQWCSMLMRTIKSLGAVPSSNTGAFWGKAMAIPDLDDRLKFLNRGQAWVVRKLEDLIPRIDDPVIRADLNNMLQAHHQNIRRVEARYASESPSAST